MLLPVLSLRRLGNCADFGECCMQVSDLPVFSLISQSTLNKAGFIRWQFSPCFLFQFKIKTKIGI